MPREMRRDVYDSGCGWEDCPTCAPLIAAEKQITHRRAIRWPKPNELADWQALEAAEVKAKREDASVKRHARRYKRQAEAKARVKRVFTHEQQAKVHAMLAERPIRKALRVSREEWLAEVWLELLNPTITVAKREAKGAAMPLARRVETAVQRARAALERRAKENALLVSIRKVTAL